MLDSADREIIREPLFFFTYYFCVCQGSEEGYVETGTVVDETVVLIEKSTNFAPGLTGDVTEDDLLGQSEEDVNEGEVLLDRSNATFVPETHSDVDENFDPDLPTRYRDIDHATPAKDVVIKKELTDTEEGKSKKKVPAVAKSTEIVMASTPPVIK